MSAPKTANKVPVSRKTEQRGELEGGEAPPRLDEPTLRKGLKSKPFRKTVCCPKGGIPGGKRSRQSRRRGFADNDALRLQTKCW